MRFSRRLKFVCHLMPALVLTLGALSLIGCDQQPPANGTTPVVVDMTPAPTVESTGAPDNSTRSTSGAEANLASTASDPNAIPNPPDRTTGEGPQLTFTRLRHDFGKVFDIRTKETTFPFRNTGTRTLTITNVKPSCGCTTLEMEKMVYEPGEVGEIKVAFAPKGRGRQSKDIAITSDATNGTLKRLIIAADIVPVLTLEPSGNLQFGTVRLGQEHTRILTMKGRYPDLVVTSVNAPNSFITASLVEDDEETRIFLPSEPRDQFKVAITLHDNAPWGGFFSTAIVKSHSTHPETGELLEHSATINVSASVYGDIQASDTIFRVGASPLRQPFTNTIYLTNSSGQPFTIIGAYLERTTMPGTELKVEPYSQGSVQGYKLIVSGDPGDYAGPVNGHVRIETNLPGEEQFKLPIMGIVREVR